MGKKIESKKMVKKDKNTIEIETIIKHDDIIETKLYTIKDLRGSIERIENGINDTQISIDAKIAQANNTIATLNAQKDFYESRIAEALEMGVVE